MTVTDGVVTGWTADQPQPDGPSPLNTLPTVDTLISTAAQAEREATGKIEITYDPDTGIPIHASIDWIKIAIDDEFGWNVRDFSVTAA